MTDYSFIVMEYIEANRRLEGVYTFQHNDKLFIGLNTVFSPYIFEDTFFFSKNLPLRGRESFLEIGCGTGLISIVAALEGARVVATDISPDALKNTRINAILHNVEDRVRTIQSDVFKSLDSSDVFDLIFWNVPFILSREPESDYLLNSVFDCNYSAIAEFVKTFPKHLNKNGRAFIGFSSTSGEFSLLKELCYRSNVKMEKFLNGYIEEKENEERFSLEIYELSKNEKTFL
jgi:HemK-related putative methylase